MSLCYYKNGPILLFTLTTRRRAEMFKKIALVLFVLIAAAVAAEKYATEVPFVKKTREILITQIQKLDAGPVGRQWDKVVAYFERLDKKANRKNVQESAMTTKAIPPSPRPPAPTSCPNTSSSKSPKTGITKSSSRKLWNDDKGVYDWKNKKENNN
jgi:hypothetical protein